MNGAQSAVVTRDAVMQWPGALEALWGQAGRSIRRKDARRHVEQCLRGLLGRVERKNGWQMAEYAGDRAPCALQRVLDRAARDADRVRDELRRYAASHLLAPGEAGILVVDETGFLKKGDKSAGAQRQYSGRGGPD